MLNSVIIIDYNLTRFNDVKIMSNYIRNKYKLHVILIRESPNKIDFNLADHVIDLQVLDKYFVDKSVYQIEKMNINPVAIIPFSDNSVINGSALAEHYNLRSDLSEKALAAFSKIEYRLKEQQESNIENYLYRPSFCIVNNKIDIDLFLEKNTLPFFLKAACEGNKRGIIKVKSIEQIENSFRKVEQFLEAGVSCEESISFEREFSADGIGKLKFITEKFTDKEGEHPVEYMQIVPALIDKNIENIIHLSSNFANKICGRLIGPYHNEIKVNIDSQKAAIIEPNRRPAGMKIWYLAEKVFGINLFEYWIDLLVNTNPNFEDKLVPKGICAIKMLKAPKTGILYENLNNNDILEQILSHLNINSFYSQINFLEIFDLEIFIHKKNSKTISDLQNNSDFMGSICLFIPTQNITEKERNYIIDISRTIENIWYEIINKKIR
ncbi:ATP-grasp domain-containing protein [Fluviispira multicolorata]|uniref:ATP-grasp domain-containing protein n=1 Tax=Fluviispira multicolorata TaxID=2654512 RepID=A0A833N539_9BACT|nr:hypothetical protein [Fluviispira multicolorata]KAB8032108.1 hypothetical protein GCL57_05530 [Fluviispira multicolorata]